jgi:hypothetical protein
LGEQQVERSLALLAGPPLLHGAAERHVGRHRLGVVGGAELTGELRLRPVVQLDVVDGDLAAQLLADALDRHAHVGAPQRTEAP